MKQHLLVYWQDSEGESKNEAKELLEILENDPETFQTAVEKKLTALHSPPDQGLVEQALELVKLLQAAGVNVLNNSGQVAQTYQTPIAPILKIPFQPNDRFKGRRQQLESLKQQLVDENNATVITQVITGLSGIGKSQLACHFAYEYRQAFPGGVFWLDFVDRKTALNSFVECGYGNWLNLYGNESTLQSEQKAIKVKRCFEQDEKRLLIFGNCEDPKLVQHWRPGALDRCGAAPHVTRAHGGTDHRHGFGLPCAPGRALLGTGRWLVPRHRSVPDHLPGGPGRLRRMGRDVFRSLADVRALWPGGVAHAVAAIGGAGAYAAHDGTATAALWRGTTARRETSR